MDNTIKNTASNLANMDIKSAADFDSYSVHSENTSDCEFLRKNSSQNSEASADEFLREKSSQNSPDGSEQEYNCLCETESNGCDENSSEKIIPENAETNDTGENTNCEETLNGNVSNVPLTLDEREKSDLKEEDKKCVAKVRTNSTKSNTSTTTPKSRSQQNSPGVSPTTSSSLSSKLKLKNPFSFLKKKSPKSNADRTQSRKELDATLAAVTVDSLPQAFVAKYLGWRTTNGLYGVKYTREPLRQIFEGLEQENGGCKPALPLTQLHISTRGIYITEHKQNTVKTPPIDSGLLPIEFLSYGVQDIQFTRVFTFILVRQMSARGRQLECHSYLCESSVACRKLALSVAKAFSLYAASLKGKPHRFQVTLQRGEGEGGEEGLLGEASNGAVEAEDFEV